MEAPALLLFLLVEILRMELKDKMQDYFIVPQIQESHLPSQAEMNLLMLSMKCPLPMLPTKSSTFPS